MLTNEDECKNKTIHRINNIYYDELIIYFTDYSIIYYKKRDQYNRFSITSTDIISEIDIFKYFEILHYYIPNSIFNTMYSEFIDYYNDKKKKERNQ